MSYQLILLGLLAEQPRHGYEIKQTFEEGSFAEYIKVSGGGLYYNLHKLVKEGYVAELNVERESNYPDRHVYEITAEGSKYLNRLLRDTLSDIKGRGFFDPLDAALIFSTLLTQGEIVIRLQRQVDRQKAKLVQLSLIYEIFRSVPGQNEPYTCLLLDHAVTRLQNDINWLEKARQQILEDPSFDRVHQEKQERIRDVTGQHTLAGSPVTPQDIRVWQDFESTLGKALQRYYQQVEQSWGEYELSEKIFSSSGEQIEKARLEYQRKVAQAWQAYDEVVQQQRTEMQERLEEYKPGVI